ncbi:hypothetical protein CISIN_1g0068981mg, partial [Citrus sinensis]
SHVLDCCQWSLMHQKTEYLTSSLMWQKCYSLSFPLLTSLWWRKQSVPVWLSSLRIQMLMSVFLPLKPFSRLIM